MECSALSPRTVWLVAILIAVLHAFMALTAANTKSPTFDEPQHLTAGYSYFVTKDHRLDPENGTLPALWAALPLLFDHLNFVPLNDRGWQRAEEGRTAHQFFYGVGNDPDQMMWQARMIMSIFGIALCLVVYRIAREFFGPVGALLAEMVAAFDPNFLAHTPLVDSDIPAAFFFTATVWSYWRLVQKISPGALLIAALSLAGLFLTKFSAPIVLPVLGAISVPRIFSRTEIGIHFASVRTALTNKWKKACALAASWLVLGAVLFAAIWGSCSFRYAAWNDNPEKIGARENFRSLANHEGTTWHWNYLLEDGGIFENSVSFARTHQLFPEAFLYGFAYVRKHEIDRPAFLDNHWSIVGFRSFFPRAFSYKTPLPVLLLFALAIYLVIANRRSCKIETILNPLFGFALVYGAFALTRQLNIGHRHLLPIYPALFVACGALVPLIANKRSPVLAAIVTICLVRQIGESVTTWPNYLAYFNQAAGGPKRGYEHLVDSSLDWGQDLPALKSWIDNHGPSLARKPVYLAYFGTADPRWYNISAIPFSPDKSARATPPPLGPGIYCISATTLQSVYAPDIGPWCAPYERYYQNALASSEADTTEQAVQVANDCSSRDLKRTKEFECLRFERLCAYLRHQKPIAQVGYSIFVFDLNADQMQRALFGPPAELLESVRVNGL